MSKKKEDAELKESAEAILKLIQMTKTKLAYFEDYLDDLDARVRQLERRLDGSLSPEEIIIDDDWGGMDS